MPRRRPNAGLSFLATVVVLNAAWGCNDDRKEANDDAETDTANALEDVSVGDVEPGSDALRSDALGSDALGNGCTGVTAKKIVAGLGGGGDNQSKGRYEAALPGDIELRNDHGRFVIRTRKGGVAMYGSTGGHLVDALPHPKDNESVTDGLREFIIAVGGHVVRPDEVKIEAATACSATVVVRGPLVPFPVLSEALGLDLPPLDVEHRYTLTHKTAAVEIATTVKLKEGAKPDTALITDAFFWSGDMQLYLPGHPVDDLPIAASTDAFAVTPNRVGTNAPAYAVVAEKKLNMVNAGGILGFLQPTITPTKAGITLRRWFAIGAAPYRDVASALSVARAARDGQTTGGQVEGVVENAFGNAFVDALDKDGKPLARCGVGADDGYSCRVPLATTKLRPGLLGDGNGGKGGGMQVDGLLARPVKVVATKTTHLLMQTMRPARIKVSVRDVGGKPIAFRLTLRPAGGKPKAKRRTLVDVDGDATFEVPAGKYDAWVHHGPFWSMHKQVLDVQELKIATLDVKLRRIVDPGPWRSADFHVHAEHSTDGSASVRYRVASAVAEELHYIVSTDHDHVTDYSPWIAAAGLGNQLVTARGVEVSTTAHGHFNAWPLPAKPAEAGNGAPRWGGVALTELFGIFDDGKTKPLVQCNHPRYSGAGYFDAIGLDPKQDNTAKQVDKKLLGCSALEVINGIAHKDTPKLLADFFALLNRGIRITATGTSDCHGRHDFAGNPRTLLRISGSPQHPVGGSPHQFDEALIAGRAIATAGPLLTIAAHNGNKTVEIGAMLGKLTGETTVTAKLRAPEWLPLGRLVVYRNGAKVFDKKVVAKPDKNGLQAFDAVGLPSQVSTSGQDEWWVAVHEPGPGSGEPGIHRPPWAVTNPVFIDGDGDGKWRKKWP